MRWQWANTNLNIMQVTGGLQMKLLKFFSVYCFFVLNLKYAKYSTINIKSFEKKDDIFMQIFECKRYALFYLLFIINSVFKRDCILYFVKCKCFAYKILNGKWNSICNLYAYFVSQIANSHSAKHWENILFLYFTGG